MRNINLLVIHCSASREDKDYTFEQLLKDHKARGFKTCGYHFFIRKDGTRHLGRPLSAIGAHVGDLNLNANSVGICYEGGVDSKMKAKDTRTEAQKKVILDTLDEVLTDLKKAGQNISKIKIKGHRELSPDKDGDGVVEPHEWVKSCPCFPAQAEYKNFVKEWLSQQN